MRERGFTLMEVMVVVVLIGIMATFATLSIGDRAVSDRLEGEATRLHQIIRLAAEEAQIKGVELGLEHTEAGYRILTSTPDGWLPYEETGPFRARELEAPFRLDLRVEGRLVPPSAPDDEAEPLPHVMMLSSGEMTPFEATLSAPDLALNYVLRGGPLGRLSVNDDGEARP